MQKYSEIVATTKADGTVEVLPGATVTVYLTGTTTLASLYSDNGITAKANPFQSAALTGRIEFYAADGRYDIKIDKAGYTTVTVADILIEDPEDIGILEDVTLVDATISTSTVTNSTLSQCILVNTEIQDVDSLQLTNTPPAVLQPRMLSWNNDEGTADLALLDGTVLQVGQELHYRARNNTASTIADGAVVWATGTSGATGRINVGLAVADGSQPGKTVMGLMTHATAAGSDGYVAAFGKVRGINTTGSAVGETWLNGDVLYLHPTIPGALTKVKPEVNGHIVVTVAIVIYAGNNGTLFVRPTADSQEADEIRYTPAGTGAVATTVQSKLRETVSVKDFGAKGDYNGTTGTDDTAAIQSAIDHAVTNKVAVYFPAGRYLTTSAILLPDGISHPYLATVLLGEASVANTTSGVFTGTQIFTTAASMFKTKTTPAGSGSMPSVSIRLSGIQFFTSYTSNPTGVCFDTMSLYGSLIDNCGFYGFDTLIYGAITNKTNITCGRMGVRRFLKRNTTYTNVSADSDITFNNINGLSGTPAGMTTDPLIDITSAAQINISNNYIDFAYIGITTGGSNQNISIVNNVFDVCYRAIRLVYGFPTRVISGNQFLNIKKTSVGFVNTPLSGMSTNNWVCILLDDERHANITITDNQYHDADRFIVFGTRGHWNIKEHGNIGTYAVSGSPAPASCVDFGNRSINTTDYPVDNRFIELQSVEGQLSTSIRGKRTAYIGLSYLIGSPPIRVRVNDDYSLSDALGSYLWGKSNLLPATDFASGWTFGSGASQVAGVFTATNGVGWSYIPFVGGAGTYVVCLNITSASGTSIIVGHSLSATPSTYVDSGISNLGTTVGSAVNSPGRAFFQLNVPSTTARIGIYLANPTSCTIDYIHVIKIA